MSYLCFGFYVFTIINMTSHHGHYIVDLYAGTMVGWILFVMNTRYSEFHFHVILRCYSFICNIFCCGLGKKKEYKKSATKVLIPSREIARIDDTNRNQHNLHPNKCIPA